MRQLIDSIVSAGEYVAKDTNSKVLLYICGFMVLLLPFVLLIETIRVLEVEVIPLSMKLEFVLSGIILLPVWTVLMIFGLGVVRQVRAERKEKR